jgi:hypothetical protein
MSIAEILETMSYGPALESDKEARAWIKCLGGETKLFIGGQRRKAKSGESFETDAARAWAWRGVRLRSPSPLAFDRSRSMREETSASQSRNSCFALRVGSCRAAEA